MSMRIITGSTGSTHVTSNDDGCYNQALWGAESTILDVGEKLEASIVDNNTIQLKDGDILLQGRHARINPNTTEDVAIGTGSVGNNRNDLIVARYTLDDTTGYEDISIVVIEGTETSGSATDPEYTEGDIRTGSTLVDFPLYRVKIEGINITAVELLAPVKSGFADAISEINNNLKRFDDFGDYELLATFGTTEETKTVNDLSNYRYIMIGLSSVYEGNTYCHSSSIFPISLFKTVYYCDTNASPSAGGSTFDPHLYGRIGYINDTQIKGKCSISTITLSAYGIK